VKIEFFEIEKVLLHFELTEINEKPSIALSLVVWHGHDATDIVLLCTMLLLRKVTYQVATL
jgi:hypothetical protein